MPCAPQRRHAPLRSPHGDVVGRWHSTCKERLRSVAGLEARATLSSVVQRGQQDQQRAEACAGAAGVRRHTPGVSLLLTMAPQAGVDARPADKESTPLSAAGTPLERTRTPCRAHAPAILYAAPACQVLFSLHRCRLLRLTYTKPPRAAVACLKTCTQCSVRAADGMQEETPRHGCAWRASRVGSRRPTPGAMARSPTAACARSRPEDSAAIHQERCKKAP